MHEGKFSIWNIGPCIRDLEASNKYHVCCVLLCKIDYHLILEAALDINPLASSSRILCTAYAVLCTS